MYAVRQNSTSRSKSLWTSEAMNNLKEFSLVKGLSVNDLRSKHSKDAKHCQTTIADFNVLKGKIKKTKRGLVRFVLTSTFTTEF